MAIEKNIRDLVFSWGWLNKFLRRNGFSLRKPTSNMIKPKEIVLPKAQEFVKSIKVLIASNIYDLNYVFNIDETSVCTESGRAKTIEVFGKSNVKVVSTGKDKQYLTVVLGGSFTGHKLPAVIIFPDKGVKTFKIDKPGNIKTYHREKGPWMDLDGMTWYINNVIEPWSRRIPEGERGLLILDNFSGHFNEDIKKSLKQLRID